MKIAIFSFYSGNIERGVENWTYELSRRLTSKHQVSVFQNEALNKQVSYQVNTLNMKVNWNSADSRGTTKRKFFLDYWSLLLCRFTLKSIKLLNKEHFDIVIPTNGGWQTLLLRIYTWIMGVKLVVVGHSGKGWDERFNLYCFPDIFIALTPEMEKWAKTVNKHIKIQVIPNGIDLKLFTPHGIKASLKLKKPVFLAVGAPEPGKRLDLVIDAVSKLTSGSLLILGGGYNEDEIRKRGQRLLANRFIMVKIKFDDIPQYYRACDVFTLPSWSQEAFGMVYLEALACGLPVVATNDETRKYIIGDAGQFIDPTDPASYAKALSSVASKKWGNIPRKQAEKFSWDFVVARYEEEFKKLLAR